VSVAPDRWQLADTSRTPWTGSGPTLLLLATFYGSHPVVIGSVGNELALWSGIRLPG
jgi:hypothetical protein